MSRFHCLQAAWLSNRPLFVWRTLWSDHRTATQFVGAPVTNIFIWDHVQDIYMHIYIYILMSFVHKRYTAFNFCFLPFASLSKWVENCNLQQAISRYMTLALVLLHNHSSCFIRVNNVDAQNVLFGRKVATFVLSFRIEARQSYR